MPTWRAGYINKIPGPCCGCRVFCHQPGFNQLCPTCGCEDGDQLRFWTIPGTANHFSLVRAQRDCAERSSAERRKVVS